MGLFNNQTCFLESKVIHKQIEYLSKPLWRKMYTIIADLSNWKIYLPGCHDYPLASLLNVMLPWNIYVNKELRAAWFFYISDWEGIEGRDNYAISIFKRKSSFWAPVFFFFVIEKHWNLCGCILKWRVVCGLVTVGSCWTPIWACRSFKRIGATHPLVYTSFFYYHSTRFVSSALPLYQG